MLEITSNVHNSTLTTAIKGRIDSTNAAEFEALMTEADTEEHLILNAEELEYISSAGLRVILKLRKKHSDLKIVNVSPAVYEIFDITGFTEMIKIKRAYRTVSVDGCDVIGKGANGTVYRLDSDTVIKVYPNADALDDIEHERDVARKALVLGVPTAIPFDVVKVEDHYASVFEMLNAESFSMLIAKHPEDMDRYIVKFVELLKQIHSTRVPEGQFPKQKEVLMKWIKGIEGQVPEDVYAKLYRLCEEVPESDCMIHGDYHTKNLMLQNDEVILIDMDTLAVGHPVLEFASIYNAFIGFYAVDHESIVGFQGFDYDTGLRIWNETLHLYFETDDEELLSLREKQAKTVGLIRILRRIIRRNGDAGLADYCRNELCRLAGELESLT